MSKKNNIRVVPHDDGWASRRDGASRASRVFDTQAEAIDYSRGVARREEGELYIHGRNGQIRERNTYGDDPFPPKG